MPAQTQMAVHLAFRRCSTQRCGTTLRIVLDLSPSPTSAQHWPNSRWCAGIFTSMVIASGPGNARHGSPIVEDGVRLPLRRTSGSTYGRRRNSTNKYYSLNSILGWSAQPRRRVPADTEPSGASPKQHPDAGPALSRGEGLERSDAGTELQRSTRNGSALTPEQFRPAFHPSKPDLKHL